MLSITLRIELGIRELVVLLHAVAVLVAWFFA
jgi:hypothetical protein